MKKGRHRRYEEARELKRGPDIDIEAIFDDGDNEEEADHPGRSAWFEDEDSVNEDSVNEAVSE